MTSLIIKTVNGSDLNNWLPDLAGLRIRVFREYPYLYDGSESYERNYLQRYIDSGEAMVVLALDAGQIVGASTGMPFEHESVTFKNVFARQDIDPGTVFYCGESVLLAGYRGQGIYKQFFRERERYACELQRFTLSAFCAVMRPDDHPLKPHGYLPLDAVWNRYGYQRHDTLVAPLRWKDINEDSETDKPMVFWTKRLDYPGRG